MNLLESIFSKASARELGIHISNYLDLFLKPYKVWKGIISNRTSSYHLVILHVIYYAIVALIAIDEPISSILSYITLEVLLTAVPFLIFIIPFKIFTRSFSQKVRANRLFRLLLIFKLQFAPIYILIALIGQSLQTETHYLILQNLYGVIIFAYIILVPIVFRLKIGKKISWIITNYIFFILFIVLYYLAFSSLDSSSVTKKLIFFPDTEYNLLSDSFEDGYSLDIIISRYIFLYKIDLDYNLSFVRAQGVNQDLLYAFLITEHNWTEFKRWSESKNGESGVTPYSPINLDKELSIAKLDSFNNSFQAKLNQNYQLAKMYKDSARFESNRKHYRILFNYYESYKRPLDDLNVFDKIGLKKDTMESTPIGKEYIMVLYLVDSEYYNNSTTELANSLMEMEQRSNRSNFVFFILFFPFLIYEQF